MANGDLYEGEWVDGKRSGFGVHWIKGFRVLRCGRWENDEFVESGPVPRRKIPLGAFLSAAGTSCGCPGSNMESAPQR